MRWKIFTFQQKPRESFRNAWGRLKSYELECPHHGYPEPEILKIFYRGLSLHYKTTLDTASKGSFITRNPEEAKRLIENMRTGKSYEKMDKERETDKISLTALKDSLDSLYSILKGQDQSGTFQIDGEIPSYTEDQDNFLGQSYPHTSFNIDSFTRDYDLAV